MAFIKCSGGGKLKETELWRNPNMTTGYDNFKQTTITTNQPITNYEYLKFDWLGTSNAIGTSDQAAKEVYTYISVIDFQKSVESVSAPLLTLTGWGVSNRYSRIVYYKGPSSIQFNNAWKMTNSGSVSGGTSPTIGYPLYIYGLK